MKKTRSLLTHSAARGLGRGKALTLWPGLRHDLGPDHNPRFRGRRSIYDGLSAVTVEQLAVALGAASLLRRLLYRPAFALGQLLGRLLRLALGLLLQPQLLCPRLGALLL